MVAFGIPNDMAIVRLLLENGADVNHRNDFLGGSLLEIALQTGSADMAKLSLEYGADIHGAFLRSTCMFGCSEDMTRFLQSHMNHINRFLRWKSFRNRRVLNEIDGNPYLYNNPRIRQKLIETLIGWIAPPGDIRVMIESILQKGVYMQRNTLSAALPHDDDLRFCTTARATVAEQFASSFGS